MLSVSHFEFENKSMQVSFLHSWDSPPPPPTHSLPSQKGQLGHGDLLQRNVPTIVEGLKGKFITTGVGCSLEMLAQDVSSREEIRRTVGGGRVCATYESLHRVLAQKGLHHRLAHKACKEGFSGFVQVHLLWKLACFADRMHSACQCSAAAQM